MITFLEYQNNHTCLPISGSFAILARNLTLSRWSKNFNILGLISSSPAAFPDFIPLIVVATSAVKTSSSPKRVTSCVSWVDAFTGFRRSSKYSLHHERISFSFVRMLCLQNPWWSTIHCDTTFFYENQTKDGQPKYFVCRKIVGIQPTTKLFQWLLWFLYCQSCRSLRLQYIGIANETTICLVARPSGFECTGIFLRLNSFLNLLVPPRLKMFFSHYRLV